MADEEGPMISVRENGFLRVANAPRLTGSDGSEMERKPVMVLCRCGGSGNKPFCDGSHMRNGFDGAAQDNAARDRVYTYEGAEIDVHYDKLLCSHAAECGRRLGAVFDATQRPWIRPDEGTADSIRDVVRACPSGALRYSDKGAAAQHLLSDKAGITVQKDGPYQVNGIPLEDGEFSAHASREKYVLCRCGHSGNKPFCDGSHRDQGWSDEG